MKQRQWALGALLFACCALAQAQWVWRDSKNVRQYSDQPPPASVPRSQILKAPPGQMPDLRKELAEAATTPPVPIAPAAKVGPSLADRNADYDKRRAAAAQTAQQAAVEAQNKAAQDGNCQSARDNERTLQSGIRIASTDANGERIFLDDAQKAEQLKRSREVIAVSCK